MTSEEGTRVLVFLGGVGMVYGVSALFLLDAVVARMRARSTGAAPEREPSHAASPNRPSRRGRTYRILRTVAGGLACLGVLCIAYGFVVEPYWLDVTHERIVADELPPGSRSVRIAQVSDLHCDSVERIEDEVVEALRSEAPDLIVFTGDCVNSLEAMPLFKKSLRALSDIAPTYVIRGNWDVWFWPERDRFGDTGAVELDGAGRVVEVEGVRFWLGGAMVGDQRSIDRGLAQVPQDLFSVFLYHSPDVTRAASAAGVDLFLTGHTHGGQIALPGYGALVTLTEVGKLYESGRYQVGSMVAYVNRGLGMEGGGAPRVRFCARPELTIFEIAPAH